MFGNKRMNMASPCPDDLVKLQSEFVFQLQQGVVLLRHHLKFFDTAVCTNLLGGSADTYSHGYLTVFQTDTQVLLQPGNHRSKLFCNDFIIHNGFERGGVQQGDMHILHTFGDGYLLFGHASGVFLPVVIYISFIEDIVFFRLRCLLCGRGWSRVLCLFFRFRPFSGRPSPLCLSVQT